MKVIVAEVDKKAVVREIENSLLEIQSIVEGYVELLYIKFNDKIYIVFCNEDALIYKLKPNRCISGKCIHGNFVVTGYDGYADITGLTDEEANLILEKLNVDFHVKV